MHSDGPWWLNLPPGRDCGQSHVLTDCARRLPFEVSTDDR
jgi:hypothetical protein